MSAMKQQLVLGTLVITVFLVGCKPETSAKLDSLPNGVSFSGKLDKVRYDAAQKALIVKGDLTMDDYNALLAMSGDYEYRKAVDRLFEWTNREESANHGYLRMLVDPAVQQLAKQMKQNFLSGRTEALIEIFPEKSRKAVAAVLNDEVRFALIIGGLKPEELAEAQKKSAQVSRFARDAICVVVNPKNMIDELRLSQVGEIFSGKVTNWGSVGGKPMNIRLLLPLEQDGRRDFLEDTLGIKLSDKAESTVTEAQLLEIISKDSSAIGFVSMASAKPFLNVKEPDTTKFKVLAIRANEQGAKAVLPYQAFVAQSKYPLIVDVYAFFRTDLGKFPPIVSAYMHASQKETDGQFIVNAMGMVPTRVQIQLTE
jgi:phosphate transport system substrate-binding protein